jgi:catechol 2,3-dioxygenase-like lactoylglutathione lyase family enzyme
VFHGVAYPLIAVRHLDAALERHAALLGRPPSWRGVQPEAGTAGARFRTANSGLALVTPRREGPLGRALAEVLERDGEGLVALAFATADADACAAALRARGIAAGEPRIAEDADPRGAVRGRWRSVALPLEATRGVRLLAVEGAEAGSPQGPPPEPSRVSGLDHVVVTSPAPDAACALYGERLGLRLALDRRFEARGLRILFFRVGGVTVEVVGALDAPAEPALHDRFGGLAWRVGSADAARARLIGAGFDVSEVRAGFKPGTRVCSVRSDTCGVPTLLIGQAPRRPEG